MRRLVCSIVAVLIGLSLPASGENRIVEWSGHYEQGVHYQIQQIDKVVVLYQDSDPDIPWRFYAYDTNGGPGDIDRIYIERTGALGTVRLRIEADPNDPNLTRGARHVGAINLVDGSDGWNTLEFLDLSGNVNGHPDEPDYGLRSIYAGRLIVDGTVAKQIYVSFDITADVNIGTLAADFTCLTAHNLTVSGTAGDPLPQIYVADSYQEPYAITVGGSLRRFFSEGHIFGDISVTGSLGLFELAQPGGNISGNVTVTSDLGELKTPRVSPYVWSGDVAIGGNTGPVSLADLAGTGSLSVGGDLESLNAGRYVSGSIAVAGDVLEFMAMQSLDETGSIHVGSVSPHKYIEMRQSLMGNVVVDARRNTSPGLPNV